MREHTRSFRNTASLVLAILLFTVSIGCAQKLGPAAAPIKEAALCKSIDAKTGGPSGITNTFPPADTIYCWLKLADVKPMTQVIAQWWLVTVDDADKEKWEPGLLNKESKFTRPDMPPVVCSLPPPPKHQLWKGGFPRGDYKVTITINDVEKVSLPFKVK